MCTECLKLCVTEIISENKRKKTYSSCKPPICIIFPNYLFFNVCLMFRFLY